MYYPCSENKGANQLHGYREAGYREADLRLCFRICRLMVFSRVGSFIQCIESVVSQYICTNRKNMPQLYIINMIKIHLYKGDTFIMVLMFCLGVEFLCCLHLMSVFKF